MTRSEDVADEASQYLEFRRGAELEEGGYLYLRDKWYEVVEISGNTVMGGPVGASTYPDLRIDIDPESLYVTMPADAPVRFRRGQPHLVDWPDSELIYVEEAYRMDTYTRAANTSKRLHGLFLRQRDFEEGSECYVPLGPEEQGIPAGWILEPDRSLIVSWKPVSVSEILKEVAS